MPASESKFGARRAGGLRLAGATPIKNKNMPLVSVITAVFNGAHHLEKCLESVEAQDYPNVEHIVIDGGSNDGTLKILERHSSQIAFWKSEPDGGIYDAWNKGLTVSEGEWICFLGADDEFSPQAISSYMTLAQSNPNAEFLSSRIRVVYPSGYVKIAGEPWRWDRFARFMCAVHVGSMHKRSLFEKHGFFDTSYKSAADYELLLRSRESLKAAFMPEVTVTMQAGGASTTRSALKEKARAKTKTGGRSQILTLFELLLDNVKFAARPLIYPLRNFIALRRRKAQA